MKNSQESSHGILYNLMVLLSVLSGAFLIIFLKLEEGKGVVHSSNEEPRESRRVKVPEKITSDILGLNSRQQRILLRIKRVGSLDPKEIYVMFPKVSSRTIRRDMDLLVNKKQVKQDGMTKSTKYIYIGG
ncbi:DeoR family transcriptional regulator [Candidatus Microgenomates bacterium]|nr:DeoR family transcriptional regulator [Candidatus Microgenomates bacterium]